VKTQGRRKGAVEEPRPYAPLARTPTADGAAQAEHASVTKAEPEKDTDADWGRGKLQWVVGVYVVVAAVSGAVGERFESIYWTSFALFFAVATQPRERVPKLLRFFATAALTALVLIKVVMWILKLKGV
jgi:hypothetical protein